ncbi:MAG: DUF3108 domain-containing protein [Chthoniobacterales bacterium]
MSTRRSLLCTVFLACGWIAPLLPAAPTPQPWESTVSPYQPGSFPEPRPVKVQYIFGWNGFPAATATLRFSKADGRLRFEATGETTGLARKLWDYQINHTAISEAQTLRPLEVKEHESDRQRQLTTELTFTPDDVTSQQEERKGARVKTKTRHFDFPNVLSINSALLLLRTHPFPRGAVQRIVVYPATSAYLCTITSLGHEQITVPTGSYDAIKLDLQLSKIDKGRALQPHKKFKRATVWLSNDPDRLPLRIEAQIFIGTVFAELQSAQFENGKP